MSAQKLEFEVGTVRGPWKTSPGNSFPYMAYCLGPGGWVPFHAKTGLKALNDAKEYRDEKAAEWAANV
jgi:hypothetical protein